MCLLLQQKRLLKCLTRFIFFVDLKPFWSYVLIPYKFEVWQTRLCASCYICVCCIGYKLDRAFLLLLPIVPCVCSWVWACALLTAVLLWRKVLFRGISLMLPNSQSHCFPGKKKVLSLEVIQTKKFITRAFI